MDQNGASNGEDAKPEGSPPASGSGSGKGAGTSGSGSGSGSTSTKKRRKVNHGTSSRPSKGNCPSEIVATVADIGTCSCSLCILSTICKYCIGSSYKGGSLVDAPTRRLFGSN
jgi:hypothetical protein